MTEEKKEMMVNDEMENAKVYTLDSTDYDESIDEDYENGLCGVIGTVMVAAIGGAIGYGLSKGVPKVVGWFKGRKEKRKQKKEAARVIDIEEISEVENKK